MNIHDLVRPEVRNLVPYKAEEHKCPLRMDANENPYPLPKPVRERIAAALSAVPLNHYPDPSASKLKAFISQRIGVDAGQIVLGNGSDELIQMILMAFGGPDVCAVYPVPTFSMYGIIASSMGQPTCEIPLDDKFDIVPDEFPGKGILFLSWPNNPTGNCFSQERMEQLIAKFEGIVVVDEAYYDFARKTFLPKLAEMENLIILRTLSKIGLAGLRIGILVANPAVVKEIEKVRLPYNINSLSQVAATEVLADPGVIDAQINLIVEERENLYYRLRGLRSGITTFPSDANFVLIRVKDAARVHEGLIADEGILVRNLSRPGPLENCLRITVGMQDDNHAFLVAISRLTRIL